MEGVRFLIPQTYSYKQNCILIHAHEYRSLKCYWMETNHVSAWEGVCRSIDICQFLYFRAADWNLNEPQWTGRLRLVAKEKECILKLEDKTTGELFAKCPIDQYPGIAIEAVTDSSRYFVIRIQDDNGNDIIWKCGLRSG